ncbi:L-aspartate oxidase [Priestia taiwanensis]|uniref:L-aspartate oxidase n=1 Tax=Priestia taiwanensis TaxID=1347902 RepID=A0A917EQH3_9BACI|nr:L-aspartate oxidase [Priestia taiwanensis]MBM7363627.1 L-aspartate oxidase [Priestia taiwanensis]GGE75486.1 L-aspartate oxidase [Priestia taiwanensis]
MPKDIDVLIIGSGIAALMTAARLCTKKKVVIITKKHIRDSNSMLAQGGVAVAIAEDDDWKHHFDDTMKAGCYANKEEMVELLVKEGPGIIRSLIDDGLLFDQDEEGNLLLGQEGAHRMRRILHAGGDRTGAFLTEYMIKRVQEHATIIENETAIDLLVRDGVCVGAVTRTEQARIKTYVAKHTILATGGSGGLYRYTSNAETITGDGIALAYRAGCELEDLEFVQFHPTMLYVNGHAYGLVSEAVRGEGAILVTRTGERVMQGVHEMGDLAPRDVVSREIYKRMLQKEEVFLDISMIANFEKRFPTITALCRQYGISIEGGSIPVVPGAHFHMGGVKTNEYSETSIPNLYAVGEVACQGVHGANRLASNSLLEGLVYGNRLGEHLLCNKHNVSIDDVDYVSMPSIGYSLPTQEEIQHVMMEYVGIVREEVRLLQAREWFESFLLQGEVHVTSFTNEQLTTYNMVTVGWLITKSALERTSSIGAHYRQDREGMVEGVTEDEYSKS